MPSTYAHFTFGKEVYKSLPSNIKRIIKANSDAFYTGLHGPDILFYYKPFSSNYINRIGYSLHQKIASNFLLNARDIIRKTSDNELYSYIVGFICHFMLDSECHHYIGEKIIQSGVSHAEIEVEFDRMLMVNNSINPISFNPTQHIKPNLELSEKIALLYPNINGKQIFKTIKSMKFYNELLICPNKLKRTAIISLLNLTKTRETFSGLIINLEPNLKCKDSNQQLTELYTNAVPKASIEITEYCKNISNDNNLSERFNKNFE